jgi:organic radical activating enzyme
MLRLNDINLNLPASVLSISVPNVDLHHTAMLVLQGCSQPKCKGCMSEHTWSADSGTLMEASDLVDVIFGGMTQVDRLIVSGGEPLDQYEELIHFLRIVNQRSKNVEIQLYTSHSPARLRKLFSAIFDVTHIILAGRYVEQRNLQGAAYGSSNQIIIECKTGFMRSAFLQENSLPVQVYSQGLLANTSRITLIGL